jgi:hypothetical protein
MVALDDDGTAAAQLGRGPIEGDMHRAVEQAGEISG